MEERIIKALLKDENFKKSMLFALEKHSGQTRIEGTPYIFHPVRTFYILSKLFKENKIESYTILNSALLHDTIEDTDATKIDLQILVGEECADIVDELTLPQNISKQDKKIYLGKKLPNLSEKALSIKLADRLDNISALNILPETKKNRYLKETQYIIYKLEHSNRKFNQEQKYLIQNLHETIDSYSIPIIPKKEK